MLLLDRLVGPEQAYDLMGIGRSLMPTVNPRDNIYEMNEIKEFLPPPFDRYILLFLFLFIKVLWSFTDGKILRGYGSIWPRNHHQFNWKPKNPKTKSKTPMAPKV